MVPHKQYFAGTLLGLSSCASYVSCSHDTLHWRHNEHDGVSNHQPHGCLLNRLFRRRSKKTSKLRVTGLYVGTSPGPVNSPHKGSVTRKMFSFDDVIMIIDDVLMSQNKSNFEIDTSPSIFELERRSKAQNVGNASGYLFDIFNFRYNFRAQHGVPFENLFDLLNTNLTSDMKRSFQIMPKGFSWWRRHRWRHRRASKSALYIPLWIK